MTSLPMLKRAGLKLNKNAATIARKINNLEPKPTLHTITQLINFSTTSNNYTKFNIEIKMKMKNKAAILYHYPCPDGVFAALAAHLYFSSTSIDSSCIFFPNTVYSPLRVEDLPLSEISVVYLLDFVGPPGFFQNLCSQADCPEISVGYLLDFVGPPEFFENLCSQADCVVVLDHHKTALETLGAGTSIDGKVTKVIDMDRSGATIAYDYFKEKLLIENAGGDRNGSIVREYERVRKLFEYIEDADLWRWRLPDSKAFSSGLKDFNIEFNARLNPTLFQQLLSLDYESIIKQGKISLSHKQKRIDEILEQSYEIALGGGAFGHCLAVNADSVVELRSELGHQLATKSQTMNLRGIGAIIYQVPELKNDQLLKVSLRSVHTEDTTPISQGFGGGGHRNASSFMLNCKELEKWKVAR